MCKFSSVVHKKNLDLNPGPGSGSGSPKILVPDSMNVNLQLFFFVSVYHCLNYQEDIDCLNGSYREVLRTECLCVGESLNWA